MKASGELHRLRPVRKALPHRGDNDENERRTKLVQRIQGGKEYVVV